jgi:hypothetical protein
VFGHRIVDARRVAAGPGILVVFRGRRPPVWRREAVPKHVSYFAAGPKWCGNCGSSLFGRNPSRADPIGIRMGTFDLDPGIRPSVRQFVRYAAPWEPIPDDGLPRHPESRHSRD